MLIYHTHTSESYMDEDVDYFYESYYSRTQNNDYNVTAVGDAITDVLNKRGIKTMHDTTVHDSTYSGSYDRSAQTVESIMETNTDIKVIIDIHRDAIGTETQKVKPVFTYDGKQGAQIMILSGCDTDGEMNFLSWENNLNFALKIQNKAEEMYPGKLSGSDDMFLASLEQPAKKETAVTAISGPEPKPHKVTVEEINKAISEMPLPEEPEGQILGWK